MRGGYGEALVDEDARAHEGTLQTTEISNLIDGRLETTKTIRFLLGSCRAL